MKLSYAAKMFSNGSVIYHCFGDNIESLQVQMIMLLERELSHTYAVIVQNDTGHILFQCRKSAY